jgi:hypothetical protein
MENCNCHEQSYLLCYYCNIIIMSVYTIENRERRNLRIKLFIMLSLQHLDYVQYNTLTTSVYDCMRIVNLASLVERGYKIANIYCNIFAHCNCKVNTLTGHESSIISSSSINYFNCL